MITACVLVMLAASLILVWVVMGAGIRSELRHRNYAWVAFYVLAGIIVSAEIVAVAGFIAGA